MIPHWYATSDKDDTLENLDGFEEYRDPTKAWL